MMTEKQQAAAAEKFAERWQGRGYERGEAQPFWIDLLTNVFGISTPSDGFITFEEHHMVDKSNYIDGRIPSTRVLIEHKSKTENLRSARKQSDGSLLTPFQQARRYVVNLPVSQHPRWIVTCNFKEFLIYDMEQPNSQPEQILLESFDKEYYRLRFLVDANSEHVTKEMEVSMKAGEIVGKIYDALLKQYNDNSPQAQRWLNILCVRIVFCLYAEDAGIFHHDQFHDYLDKYEVEDCRRALKDLFEILKTPVDKRSKYLKDDLQAFPYTNGGLFEEEIEIPQFTEDLKHILLQKASLDFDWSDISPTIFGAVFESTLNPETRRGGGMHYTSSENIHKVIDPLFLNDLRHELDDVLEEKVEKQRQKKLEAYQNKLASLTFLDPACGSGNFLTETYLSLRRLENEAIRERFHGQMMMGEIMNTVKVSIHQFYGIEINDFAVTVATTALWISESQMLTETEKIIQHDIDFLPLKSYANIKEGNALRMDWSTLEETPALNAIYAEKLNIYKVDDFETVPHFEEKQAKYQTEYKELNVITKDFEEKKLPECTKKSVVYDYIIGNPPFVGYTFQTERQKEDLLMLPGKIGKNIDYVTGWYLKAADLIQNKPTKCAFVSTNSISQGEQVAEVWNVLLNLYNIQIDFAYRTFRWDSESDQKAHVHCVIIGFSYEESPQNVKFIIDEKGEKQITQNINPYLLDAPNILINKRKTPLCNVSKINKGSQPTDGGNLIISSDEYEDFIEKEPAAKKFIREFLGAEEFINGKKRYCLWLVDASPAELRKMPLVMKRIDAVKEMRLLSKKEATKNWASYPYLFTENRQPTEGHYLLIPRVSSEKRYYIPIGYVPCTTIASDAVQIIPNASLYEFGVLTSNVHNAWMRVVCGRLKSDYRYSNDIVYNNFPWPNPTEEHKIRIEQTARAILDARALYQDASLADLYDERTMPPQLRKAHFENDKAVMQAYGFNLKWLSEDNEDPIVAELFKMYQRLTDGNLEK